MPQDVQESSDTVKDEPSVEPSSKLPTHERIATDLQVAGDIVPALSYSAAQEATSSSSRDTTDKVPEKIDSTQNQEKNVRSPSTNDRDVKVPIDQTAISPPKGFLAKLKAKRAGKGGKNGEPDEPRVGIRDLFRYASRNERIMIGFGLFAACVYGAGLPSMTILFSDIIGTFIGFIGPLSTLDPNSQEFADTATELYNIVLPTIGALIGLGVAVMIAGAIEQSIAFISGERQTLTLRDAFFTATLRQDTTWFDERGTGDISSALIRDAAAVQDGISEKLFTLVQTISTLIVALIISFSFGWQMTLVLLASMPLAGVSVTLIVKFASANTAGLAEVSEQGDAGVIAQEALSNIRTVNAFGSNKHEITRYCTALDDQRKRIWKAKIIQAIGFGVFFFTIFAVYALGFYYGSLLVLWDIYSPEAVLKVFYPLLVGFFSLGNIGPNLEALGNARAAARRLFDVIDRVPKIDPYSEEGFKSNKVEGTIEFRDVSFSYPTRPDVKIFDHFNLTIPAGKSIALVGASGSGKSTLVQLIERFYDPDEGAVLLDGRDIRDYNLQWYRRQLGLVSQEPTLFDGTVYDNIVLGYEGKEECSREAVHEAAKAANAHDFISDLPNDYDTWVGEKGGQMSGGQKQRIVIARALMQQPTIMLLDEATSALDTVSEKLVQAALDKVSESRTSVIVAHRLSTIRDVHEIIVMDHGKILDRGNHEELLTRKGGTYAQLVRAQELREKQQEDDGDDKRISAMVHPEQLQRARSRSGTAPVRSQTLASVMSTSKSIAESVSGPKESKLHWKDMLRMLKFGRVQVAIIVLGLCTAAGLGTVFPLFGFILANFLSTLGSDGQEFIDGTQFLSLMFLVLAIGAGFCAYFNTASFQVYGEKLTRRVRKKTFEAILKQEIGFFDDPTNGTGRINALLEDDAAKVKTLVSVTLSTTTQLVVTVITGLVIAFIHNALLTLVVLCLTPFIAGSIFVQLRALRKVKTTGRDIYANAGQIAVDALLNLKSVQSLGKQRHFSSKYNNKLSDIPGLTRKSYLISASSFGFTNGIPYVSYAIGFWVGTAFIIQQLLSVEDLFVVLMGVIFATQSVGRALGFSGDFVAAKAAANGVLAMWDRVPQVDPNEEYGQRPVDIEGRVSAQNVRFTYPTRPDVTILRGLGLDAEPGKQIALVGASGSGKSTVIQLIERFYEANRGEVNVENLNVADWNLHDLRNALSLVSQEPNLFSGTVGDNIKYGKLDATMEEIQEAAKMANIHDFILELPQGYDTPVSGSNLSGGQKQRVAIARALIRKPKILLLDEATSALDSDSEKVVQAALEKAAKGRTTITIAHRLSTIQDSDRIYVIRRGRVCESGTHDELMADARGVYHEMVNQQRLAPT